MTKHIELRDQLLEMTKRLIEKNIDPDAANAAANLAKGVIRMEVAHVQLQIARQEKPKSSFFGAE